VWSCGEGHCCLSQERKKHVDPASKKEKKTGPPVTSIERRGSDRKDHVRIVEEKLRLFGEHVKPCHSLKKKRLGGGKKGRRVLVRSKSVVKFNRKG